MNKLLFTASILLAGMILSAQNHPRAQAISTNHDYPLRSANGIIPSTKGGGEVIRSEEKYTHLIAEDMGIDKAFENLQLAEKDYIKTVNHEHRLPK